MACQFKNNSQIIAKINDKCCSKLIEVLIRIPLRFIKVADCMLGNSAISIAWGRNGEIAFEFSEIILTNALSVSESFI